MSTEENKAVIRRYFELYNQGNLEALRELFISDLVCHIGGVPEPIRGLQANLEMDAYHRAAFSDIRSTLQDVFAEGDKVAVRRTWSLRHTGGFEGIPPSGRELSGTAVDIFRLENGKIAESWTESDNLSFMQQLGALPASGASELAGL